MAINIVILYTLIKNQKEAEKFHDIYGKDQSAIYKTKIYFALVIKGDGTFTRTYRLNEDLKEKYPEIGTYFLRFKRPGKGLLL